MQDSSYLGVYSTCAPNAKGHMQKRMHFVWSDDAGKFHVQTLDGAFQPVGIQKLIGPVEFKKNYTHEPTVLAMPVSTGKPWLGGPEKQTQSTGKKLSLPGLAPDSKEPEAKQTENYLRDVFGKTLKRARFARERNAALNSLKTLVEVEEGIVPEHKFMFTDFGIALRKNALLELALACSKRVLDLSPGDDHAHFNIARILFEMNQLDDAEQHLLTAQSINGNETTYQKMLDYIQQERRRRFRPQKASATGQPTKRAGSKAAPR